MPDRPVSPLPWRLRLLGGFTLERGAQRLTRLHSRAAVLLLARLAMAPGRAQAREELADWLWPEADAATGRARLRQTLSTLKATLERTDDGAAPAVIEGDRLTLRLVPGAVDCDVLRFQAAARQGDRTAAAAAWGGELLPGRADDWVLEQRRHLQALGDRLGLGAGVPGPAPDAAPAPVSAPAAPAGDGLPQYLTPLAGGDGPVRALAEAAAAARWLVVQGPGGLGKTRLSVHAARRLLADGQVDTARFVAWAGCTDAASMAARLRLALDPAARAAPAGGAAVEAALDLAVLALAGRRALLLLDNAEQLADDALAMVPRLLDRLPGLRVIVTTRRALDAAGAQTWRPAPLAVDGPACAALRMFVDRARAVRPDFHCHAGNQAAILGVVRRLQGLPLAIELAAAGVRSLPPARLAERLDEQGAERWRLLARRGPGGRDDPRHASLAAVVETSLGLLAPPARRMLEALAVADAPVGATLVARHPAAGADAEAAWQALVGDGLLVEVADDGHDRWCTLPEPVRDLARERLTPAHEAELRRGWRPALCDWAATLAPAWPLARVEQALPLLLALLQDAGPGPEEVLALMRAFAPVWPERPPPPAALEALEAALDAAGTGTAGWAEAATLAAGLALAAGRGARARARAAAIEPAALPPGPARAQALLLQARVAWRVDADAAGARARLAQARSEAAGHPGSMAALLSLEATLANEADHDPAHAADAYRLALHWLAAEPRAHGHARRGLRYNLAITAIYRSDPAAALAELEALADEARSAGDRHLLAQVLNARGSALDLLGRTAEAEQATRAALAEAWSGLATENMLYALWNLGPLALAQDDARRAARLMGFADRFWRTHFGALGPTDARDVARTRRRCRQRLGRAAGQRAWDEGAALPLASAVSLALA